MYLVAAAMEPEQMENLIMCTSSKAMWDRLGTIHEQRSASRQLLLIPRFHEYGMEPTDSVVQHVSKVQKLATQLLDFGVFLASLPQRYKHFRSAWCSVEPARQTIEFLQE